MPQSPDAPAQPAPRTPEQTARLTDEWRRLRRGYAFHPIVRVVPLEGDPPTVYQIDYRVRTLEINAAGQLDYAATCSVQVTLPPEFPIAPPLVRPVQAIFHPNVDAETVRVIPDWSPAMTLLELVERVGRVLAFQVIEPHDPWNPVAMDWVVTNRAYVPTDPSADVSPAAGGEALSRVCSSGPATLPSLREQVRKFSDSLLDPIKPPAPSDVRYFATRTRQAVGVFLDGDISGDIPEPLATQAREIDEWAAALPAVETTCAALRKVAAAALGAAATADVMAEAAKKLNLQLHAMKPLNGDEIPSKPAELLGRLPPAVDLQKAHSLLRAALANAEQKLTAARAAADSLELPAADEALPPPLQVLIDAERGHKQAVVRDARGQLETKLVGAEPIVARARREAGALERMLLWREFIDTRDRAAELAGQVTGWGASGVQAFFLANDSGEHGPFDYEQQVDLGVAQLVVRKVSHHAIEAIELGDCVALGRTETGDLHVTLPGGETGAGYATTIHPTPRCDDLALQLDYAVTRTRALLARLDAPAGDDAAASWNGAVVAALSRRDAITTVMAEHAAVSAGWAALAADLRALSPFKERLATYHLLLRVRETLPGYQKRRAEASAALKKAAARVAAIEQRSSKDLETGRVLVPNKFLKEYTALLEQIDALQVVKDRMSAAIKSSAAHVQARTVVKKGAASPIGSAKRPALRALAEMPVDVGELAAAMGDATVLSFITEIEGLVNTQLYFGRRPAAPKANLAAAPAIVASAPVAPAADTSADQAAEPAPVAEEPTADVAAPDTAPPAHAEDWPAAGDPGHGHDPDPFAVHAEPGHDEADHEGDEVFVDWPT